MAHGPWGVWGIDDFKKLAMVSLRRFRPFLAFQEVPLPVHGNPWKTWEKIWKRYHWEHHFGDIIWNSWKKTKHLQIRRLSEYI